MLTLYTGCRLNPSRTLLIVLCRHWHYIAAVVFVSCHVFSSVSGIANHALPPFGHLCRATTDHFQRLLVHVALQGKAALSFLQLLYSHTSNSWPVGSSTPSGFIIQLSRDFLLLLNRLGQSVTSFSLPKSCSSWSAYPCLPNIPFYYQWKFTFH